MKPKTSKQTADNSRKLNSANGEKRHLPEDYSVYLPIDRLRESAPWSLQSYGDDGALSKDDMSTLVAQFHLPAHVVTTLSQQIGYCLDTESEVNLVEVNRFTATKRAQVQLEEAARLAKRIEADSQRLAILVDPLATTFSQDKNDAKILASAKNHTKIVRDACQGLSEAIVEVIKTPGAAADTSPHIRAKVWDKRRQAVVETCCYAWLDVGRSLTYTTASHLESEFRRQGKLVDFIQAVVSMVTAPATRLPGDTLRKDIDRLKRQLDLPNPLLMPPK